MKTKMILFALAGLTYFGSLHANNPDQSAIEQKSLYCLPSVSPNSGCGITRFSLSPSYPLTQNSQPGEGFSYYEFSNCVLPVKTHIPFELHLLTNGSCESTAIKIYADANHDHSFNSVTELIYSSVLGNYGTTVNGGFEIPSASYSGETRLRVMVKKSTVCGFTEITPCNDPLDPNGFQGEVEDYFINISPANSLITEANTPGFSVFPNPASGEFYVAINEAPRATTHIRFENAEGKLLLRMPAESAANKISAEGLTNGIYFVSLETATGIFDHKIICIQNTP